MSDKETPMDERVFGPYYGTPPEKHTHDSVTVQVFNQPVRPTTTRPAPRWRLLTGRKRRTPNTRP